MQPVQGQKIAEGHQAHRKLVHDLAYVAPARMEPHGPQTHDDEHDFGVYQRGHGPLQMECDVESPEAEHDEDQVARGVCQLSHMIRMPVGVGEALAPLHVGRADRVKRHMRESR